MKLFLKIIIYIMETTFSYVLGYVFNSIKIFPTAFNGYPLYKLHLKGDSLNRNTKVTFKEGKYQVLDIIMYDILLNIIIFSVEDDIIDYAFIEIK